MLSKAPSTIGNGSTIGNDDTNSKQGDTTSQGKASSILSKQKTKKGTTDPSLA